MTDEVIEAMARGLWEASGAPAHVPYGWHGLAETTRERWRDHIRAAIRAVTERGGLVVAKVPEDAPYIHTGRDERTTEYANGHSDGWDACIAAVRASAVEVK